MFRDEQEAWRFLLEQEFGMQESIVIACDTIVHTDEHPFCDDPKCPCHGCATWEDVYRQNEYLENPFDDGLLTVSEKHRLYWGQQV
jgi:hypothetical protein